MNCECIKEIETGILEKHKTWNGKKVIDVKIPKIFTFNPNDIRTAFDVVIKVENQKKEYEVSLTHSFCPFCGIKQGKDS